MSMMDFRKRKPFGRDSLRVQATYLNGPLFAILRDSNIS